MAIILLLCGTGTAMAQMRNEGSKIVDAKLKMHDLVISDNHVTINYEIPFSGMVEIRLFDESGIQIWQNQYDHTYGENRIVLRTSKFDPGKSYGCVLNYKRDEVRQTILVPAGMN